MDIFSGIISKAIVELGKYIILSEKERYALSKAIERAYDALLRKSEDFHLDRKIFKHHLDQTMFNKIIVEELWGRFFDLSRLVEQPDIKKIYRIYKDQFQTSWALPEETFENAFDYFWSIFLTEVKSSKDLRERYRDRVIFLIDTHVTTQEVKDYIIHYCKHWIEESAKEFKKILRYGDKNNENYQFIEPSIVWVDGEERNKWLEVNSIQDEILSLKKQRIVFYGNAGVGKTTFLRYLEKEFLAIGQLAIYLHSSEIDSDTEVFLREKIKTKLNRVFRDNTFWIPETKMEGFVQYLFRYNKIVFIIDAYDQTNDVNLPVINRLIQDVMKKRQIIISTRPYSLNNLLENIDEMDLAEIKEFDNYKLMEYFGDFFNEAIEMTKESKELLYIPLLAHLIKSLILNDDSREIQNKAYLFERMIIHLIEKQIKNDAEGGTGVDPNIYEEILAKLEELSLKLLRNGTKEYFHKRDAEDFWKYFTALEKAQFLVNIVKHVIDIESVEGHRENTHKFHHPNFQEYFASRQLLKLEKLKDTDELFKALSDIKYDPEVGRFFCELIKIRTRDAVNDFTFWQDIVHSTENDWVRTYALQIRDKLGESKAQESLERLFKEEVVEEMFDDIVHIPKGWFLKGSYEYPNEWPVERIYLDEYFIDKYPVTNEQFKRFIEEGGYMKEEMIQKFWSEEGRRWKTENNITIPRFWTYDLLNHPDAPVIGVSYYEAEAYARWLGKRLPTEEEWEKAARGIHGRRYPWGNKLDMDRSKISPYGCLVMTGMVWQWTDSLYFVKKSLKVLRGGSLDKIGFSGRCASRFGDLPVYGNSTCSFRCVQDKLR